MNWINLTSIEQLDEIILNSENQILGIFKHSTRCGISKMVLKQFERSFHSDANIDMYYLDLLNYRVISNEISSRFQIVHESPQLLIIKEGNVIEHASHDSILKIKLPNI